MRTCNAQTAADRGEESVLNDPMVDLGYDQEGGRKKGGAKVIGGRNLCNFFSNLMAFFLC